MMPLPQEISSLASTYVAVDSLDVLLIWIVYSTQILLIGAEFAEAYHGAIGKRESQCCYSIQIRDSVPGTPVLFRVPGWCASSLLEMSVLLALWQATDL